MKIQTIHHKLRITRSAAKNKFYLNLLSTIGLSITLAACGGSGGGDENVGGGTVNPPVPATGTFISPAGALCAKVDVNKICIEPTSSSITLDALIKTLRSSDGPLVNYTNFGNTLYQDIRAENSKIISGKNHYDMTEKSFVMGKNSIKTNKASYAYSKDESGYLQFGSPAEGASVFVPEDQLQDITMMTVFHDTSTSQGTYPNVQMHLNNDLWRTFLGVLTDTADAPKEKIVHYVGSVTLVAGTYAPVTYFKTDDPTTEQTAYSFISSGVPVRLTLNTRTGVLSAVSISDSNAEDQAQIQLTLPELEFKNSRLFQISSPKHQASASISGPMQNSDDDSSPDTPILSASFVTNTGLLGGIYGKQAAFLRLAGSSNDGQFEILAVREDLAERSDFKKLSGLE